MYVYAYTYMFHSSFQIKLYLIEIPTESTFYILSWLWLQMKAKIKYFKTDTLQTGVVAHAVIPALWEAKAGGL